MKVSFIKRTKFVMISIIIAVAILFSINMIFKTIFPMKYKDYIGTYSGKYGIDPYLVAAIINVESDYDRNAKSSKDARGLMQISPVTASWASKELSIDNFSLESLYDPEINIMIGCWYLNILNEEFNNDLDLVLAAYNGGSGNVNKWLSDDRYSKDGKNLERIPFRETREYVTKVKKNYEMYQKIYKNKFEHEEMLKTGTSLTTLINNFKRLVKSFVFQHR